VRGSDDMKPANPGAKLTYDDYLLFPDDGMRHELIDGEHYVTPSPNLRHQGILGNLHLKIGSWLESNPVGKIWFAPLDVIFTKFDVVEPDLLYISNTRLAEIASGPYITGAPDIAIEIASPGTRRRDETIKRRLYERSGVSEYWIVDPDSETVRVYRLEGGSFGEPLELSARSGGVLTTAHLPGCELPLSWVFRP
jgi:Uma2 family endonuclease